MISILPRLVVCLALGVVPGALAAAVPVPGEFFLRPGERQLFLDDYVLGDLFRLKRVIHQPRKYEGNPVVKPDLPSDGRIIQIRTAPSWDESEQVWKMWYFRSGGVGYARSRDGLHWEKPELGLLEVNGSRANNAVIVEGDPQAFIQHVLIDPQAPPDQRYKGMQGPLGRIPLVSADGFRFRRLDAPVLPSGDESHLVRDERHGRYLATVKNPGPFGRAVYLSTSEDFVNWTPPELIFHADEIDQRLGERLLGEVAMNPDLWQPISDRPADYNTEVYNMPVFAYEGLYIGLPTYFQASARLGPPFNNQDGINLVKLACSRDLRTWTKVGDRSPFISISPLRPGAMDTGQVLAASRPIRRGDELWFYYTGINVRYHPGAGDVGQMYTGGIHLARLRLDGFVSLRAAADPGSLDTRPLHLEGRTLWVNVDAAAGELRAEITDERGRQVLPGWEAARCTVVAGDHLRAQVAWPGRDFAELQGRKVRIRLHLQNADLYSFWVEP